MTERIRFYNRAAWLEGRRAMNGIGGSEAPAVLGDSKFMSRLELWRLKTGAAAYRRGAERKLFQDGKRQPQNG